MKKIFCLAAALFAGCVSCGVEETVNDLTVQLQMCGNRTRHVTNGNLAGGITTTGIKDGYLCFTNSQGIVTATYTCQA